MSEINVQNQPILNKILNKINNSSPSSQAYLLVGDDIEKIKKYAILFSKVLICPNNYCENCEACNICYRIKNGIYSELKIIEPENNIIKKEKIIELREKFQTHSIEGKSQVYIINKVDCLNPAAANSLLKFLEEPDSNTIALFTTNNLDGVINTIISRCQIIKLNNDEVKKGLEYVKKISELDEEKIDIIMNFFFSVENNRIQAIAQLKTQFIDHFNTRELLKSALTVILLLYKDALNYKLFNEMEYFGNETGIKNLSDSSKLQTLVEKIKLILENLYKLDYNVNILLFMNNILIRIGEINNDKSSRN